MIRIRTASFNRNRFNLAELEQWRKRTGATIIRCRYGATRVHVTYKGAK